MAGRGRLLCNDVWGITGSHCLGSISHEPGSGYSESQPLPLWRFQGRGKEEHGKPQKDTRVKAGCGLHSGEISRYQVTRILYAVSGSWSFFRQKKKPLKGFLDGNGKIALVFMFPTLATMWGKEIRQKNGDDHCSTKSHVRINCVLTRNYFYYKIICVYMDKAVWCCLC